MTDIQILTVALTIVIPLSLLIYSNSRVSDLSTSLGKRIDDSGKRIDDVNNNLTKLIGSESAALRAEMKELRAHIDAGFERLEHALKIHELEHHK